MASNAARLLAVGLVYASSVYVQALAHASVSCALFSHELIFAVGSAAMAAGAVAAGWLSDRLDRSLVLQLTLGLGIVATLAAAVAHRSDTFLLLGVAALSGFLAGGAHVALVVAFEASSPRLRTLLYLAFPVSLLPVALSLEVVETMPVWASVSTALALMGAAVFSIFALKHSQPITAGLAGSAPVSVARHSVAVPHASSTLATGSRNTVTSPVGALQKHVRRGRPSDGATLLPARALRRAGGQTASASPATPASPLRNATGTPSKGRLGRGRFDSSTSLSSVGSLDGSFALTSVSASAVGAGSGVEHADADQATTGNHRPRSTSGITDHLAEDGANNCPACAPCCVRIGKRTGLVRCLQPLRWRHGDSSSGHIGRGEQGGESVLEAGEDEELALLEDSAASEAAPSVAPQLEDGGDAVASDADASASPERVARLGSSPSRSSVAVERPLTESELDRANTTRRASAVVLIVIGCLAVARSLSSLTFFVSPREPLLSDATACSWRFPPPAGDALPHSSSSGNADVPLQEASTGTNTVPLAPFGAHVIVADALALLLSAAFMSWKSAGRLRTASAAAVALVVALLLGCFLLPSYLSRDVTVAFGGDPSVEQLQLTPARGMIESFIRLASTVALQAAFLAAVEFAPSSSRGTVAGAGIALLRLSALLTAASVTYAEASLPAGARIISSSIGANSGAGAASASAPLPPPPPAEPHLQWTDYALQSVVGVRGLLMLVAPPQTPMSSAGSEAAAAAESLSAYAARAGQAAAGTLLLCALLAAAAAVALTKLPVETRGMRLRILASQSFSKDDAYDDDAEGIATCVRSGLHDVWRRACRRSSGAPPASASAVGEGSVQLAGWSGRRSNTGSNLRSSNGFTALDVVPESEEALAPHSPLSPERSRRIGSDLSPLPAAAADSTAAGTSERRGWSWPQVGPRMMDAKGAAARGAYQPLHMAAESHSAAGVPSSPTARVAGKAGAAYATASAGAASSATESSGGADAAFDIWDAPPQLFDYAFARREGHAGLESGAASGSAAAAADAGVHTKVSTAHGSGSTGIASNSLEGGIDRRRASSTASGFDSWRAAASGVGRALSHAVAAAGDALSGRHSTNSAEAHGAADDGSAPADSDLIGTLERRWLDIQTAVGSSDGFSLLASSAGAGASTDRAATADLDHLLGDVKLALRDARMRARRLRREAELLAEEAAVAKAHGRPVRRSRIGANTVESDEVACAAELGTAEAALASLQALRTSVEEAVLQLHLCARATAAASMTRNAPSSI